MKWVIGLLAVLALTVVVLLISRLPSEDAIRLAGYAATAAFAALVSVFLRWRANRAQQRSKRAG
ncbi:hypothetical protein VSR69_20265 [Paraburkholderia phytofirmans]|jgi:uncharacterized membrane protein YqjE|uniref:hypothetical protein n=1 Tax=Paraburkholderia sp. BL9I2N2 TaxID=1938809 RepID=UPI00104E16CA|nr:hypothetical protein [Paraburkholderia sp. BL9I2N2]TCK94228.1 hypothetical protein B0G74_0768 [Paraburkholderia sp. BL9I2N2]